MKVKQPTKGYKIVDIGPLDFFTRLDPPLRDSLIRMRHVVCCVCRGRFQTDEAMILGFKKHDIPGLGHGFRLHEQCWDGTGKDRTGEERTHKEVSA